MPRPERWLGAWLLACGCGDDGTPIDPGDSSSGAAESSSSGSTGIATTGTTDTSSGSSSGVDDSESSTGESSACGDGERTGIEQCDDGNDAPGDGCEPGCLLPSGDEVWTVAVDGGDDDAAHDVAVRPNGDIVVVGASGDDSWIAVYGVGGEELSASVLDLGAGDRDELHGIALRDGGMIVVGSAVASEAEGDAIVIALDDALATLWDDRFDGGLEDSAAGVAISGEDIVVVGTTETKATRADAWMRRYDGTGTEVWTQTEDGPASRADSASQVAWTPGGGLVVVGTLSQAADTDLWISARDGDGIEQWSEVLDFEFGDDSARGVVVVDDTIWVTGSIASPLSNSEELWLATYDGSGTQLSAVSWNSTGFVFDGGEDLVVDGDDVWIAGVTAAADQQRNALAGRWQRDVAEPLWVHGTDGGPGLGDAAHGIARLEDGSVVVVGELTVLGQGTDAWIRRYAP